MLTEQSGGSRPVTEHSLLWCSGEAAVAEMAVRIAGMRRALAAKEAELVSQPAVAAFQ